MTAAQLKYLAAALMVVDHVGMLFEPLSPFFPTDDVRFYLLRLVGRAVFPIFAFFVAEGCRKTHNFRHYLLRMGIFGSFTHLVAFVATGGRSGSVIATFFLAALGIWFVQRLQERGCPLLISLLPAAALAFLGELAHVDYGLAGVWTVIVLYLCGERRQRQLISLGVAMVLTYLVYVPLFELWDSPVLTHIQLYLPWLTAFTSSTVCSALSAHWPPCHCSPDTMERVGPEAVGFFTGFIPSIWRCSMGGACF